MCKQLVYISYRSRFLIYAVLSIHDLFLLFNPLFLQVIFVELVPDFSFNFNFLLVQEYAVDFIVVEIGKIDMVHVFDV